MKPVERSEILDYVTYEEKRPAIRAAILAAKEPRRIHLGEYLTFLFENHDTVRYQVQEMVRAERMVREADILHEIETYNELLGGSDGLGATLLIEIADADGRPERLARWLDLPRHLYLRLGDGTRVRPRYDERQVGEERLSSVQYLTFPVGGATPVAIGCDHDDPELRGEATLTDEQRRALAEDLATA